MKIVVMLIPEDPGGGYRVEGSSLKVPRSVSPSEQKQEVLTAHSEPVPDRRPSWHVIHEEKGQLLCVHQNYSPRRDEWEDLKAWMTTRSGNTEPEVNSIAIAYHKTGFGQSPTSLVENALQVFPRTSVWYTNYNREKEHPIWRCFTDLLCEEENASRSFGALRWAILLQQQMPRFSTLKHRIVNLLQPLALDMQYLHDIARPVLSGGATGEDSAWDELRAKADRYLQEMPAAEPCDEALQKVWCSINGQATDARTGSDVNEETLLADGLSMRQLVRDAALTEDNDWRQLLAHVGLSDTGPIEGAAVRRFYVCLKEKKQQKATADELLVEEQRIFGDVAGEDFYGWFCVLVELLERVQAKVERWVQTASRNPGK